MLSSKIALVTGASAGIGAAIVEKLVENGMKVVGCARNMDKLKEVAAKVNKTGPGEMFPHQCDLNHEDQILEVFKYIKEKFGTIHVCINNAGLSFHCSLMNGRTEEWKEMLNVNVLALCIATREAVTLMRANGVDDGHIIHINSISGHKVTRPFYSGTKFAVTGLTEGLRQELRKEKSHIRVTAISPGLVETEFAYRLNHEDPQKAKDLYSSLKSLEAVDIANTVLFVMKSPPHMEVNDVIVRPVEQTV